MWRLVKSVATRIARMAVCMVRAIPKWVLTDISELGHFSEQLHRNRTGSTELGFGSDTDIVTGERFVLLEPLLLVGVGAYKRSFASQEYGASTARRYAI